MCGVFGVYLENPSFDQIELCNVISSNIQIRGRHASGYTIYGDDLSTVTDSIPISDLVRRDRPFDSIGEMIVIAHARYSTSDLRFNQPISNGDVAIAHNGVITQSNPDNWLDQYGYDTNGNLNDSSLILSSIESGGEPLTNFPDASMAVVELHKDGILRAYRNGQRPLWFYEFYNGVMFASTKDAFIRAGLTPTQCVSGVEYKCHKGVVTVNEICNNGDIQISPKDIESYPTVYGV